MTDSATYYYATDPTGSVIGLAEFDGAASVVNHYRYDVWGMPQGNETEGAENPIPLQGAVVGSRYRAARLPQPLV